MESPVRWDLEVNIINPEVIAEAEVNQRGIPSLSQRFGVVVGLRLALVREIAVGEQHGGLGGGGLGTVPKRVLIVVLDAALNAALNEVVGVQFLSQKQVHRDQAQRRRIPRIQGQRLTVAMMARVRSVEGAHAVVKALRLVRRYQHSGVCQGKGVE